MHISKVKTAIKVGDFYLRADDNPNHIGFNYTLQDEKLIKSDIGRVYLFTSDGIIKKIGGSKSIGGIKTTLSFYLTSMQGSPGVPRFVIHLLIRDLLKNGNKVSCYMITSPKTIAKVSGLFSVYNIDIASFSEMESKCKSDYYELQGRYPEWNFQENAEPYPSKYAIMHNQYHKRRLGN